MSLVIKCSLFFLVHDVTFILVKQIQEIYLYWIVLSLSWAWYRYQYFLDWWENPLSWIWIYKWKKNHLNFFYSIWPNILCIKYVFGGISHLRQYRILVSLSKDNTCVLSQESETTQIRYFWVFKLWDDTNKSLIPSCIVSVALFLVGNSQ
jgi:hypothetical protein